MAGLTGCFYFKPWSLKSYIRNKYSSYIFSNGYLTVDQQLLDNSKKCIIDFDGSPYCQNILKNEDSDVYSESSFFDRYNRFYNQIKNLSSDLLCGFLYNNERNDIYLARDLFGLTPLFYYYKRNEFLLFSTSLVELINLPELKHKLLPNLNKINDYLEWMNEGLNYNEDTFFQGIKAVLPGHIIKFSDTESTSKNYIDFNTRRFDHIRSADEYASLTSSLLQASVYKSIHGKTVIASQLSGGLDSSTISALSRHLNPDLNLHTFYVDTHSELTNEGYLAELISEQINSTYHSLMPLRHELDISILHTSLYGFPEQMSVPSAFHASYLKSAGENNCYHMLTGNDGDSIIGHGFDYLSELLRCDNWSELKTALSSFAHSRSGPLSGNWNKKSKNKQERDHFIGFTYKLLQQKIKTASVSESLTLLGNVSKYLNISLVDYFPSLMGSIKRKLKYGNNFPSSIVHNKILPSSQHLNPIDLFPNSLASWKKDNINDVFYQQGIAISEEGFYLGKHYNVELLHPFYDKDLFELCLHIPNSIKFDNGRGRGHLRASMKGILPDEVRLRTDKAIFSTYSRDATLRLYYSSRDFLTMISPIWDYVNRSQFLKCVKLLESNSEPRYIYNRTFYFVSRTIYLALWLDFIKK